MVKLNQIIAIVNGKKTTAHNSLTELYKELQKPVLFEGISRTYNRLNEDGEMFPAEHKNIQKNVKDVIGSANELWSNLWDTIHTQDNANCTAKANVVVDGKVLAENVPVTTLLYLEKQLEDVNTFVKHLPVLDPSEKWNFNKDADCFASEPTNTVKTKKVMKTLVKYEATEQHPAQTEVYNEDVKIGEWKTIKFSSSIPASEKNAMLARISKLREAIKFAREEANNVEVTKVKLSENLLKFIFN